MKITLCQINPTVGAFDSIHELIIHNYKMSVDQGAELVVFPEMITTGYPTQDLLWENEFIEANIKLLEIIAAES